MFDTDATTCKKVDYNYIHHTLYKHYTYLYNMQYTPEWVINDSFFFLYERNLFNNRYKLGYFW